MKIQGLYAIIDTTFSPQYSHEELVRLVLLGGCKLIQLRMKDKKARGFWSDNVFDAAKKIMKLKSKFNFTFIINDYVDVAGEVGADGIHLGLNDMSPYEARQRLGKDFIIGYSSHSIDEALSAEKAGADYIAFGAIYPTKTKGLSHPIQGIAKLKTLVSIICKPVVAIGGINRSNIANVISTGASAIAMITGITQAKNVVEEVKWYVNSAYYSRE